MHKILLPIPKNMATAAGEILGGNLVAFPTETVYGLGGNAYDDLSVAKIFSYKNRESFVPLSVCYKSLKDAAGDVVITDSAHVLSDNFLPGAITLVLQRRETSKISLLCSSGLETVGIRVPSSTVAQSLLNLLPFPIAAPSANRSGHPSPTNAAAVSESLQHNKTLTILDGGRCRIGIESTIIDCRGKKLRILRHGAICEDEISSKCGLLFDQVKSSDAQCTQEIKKKHYIISKPVLLNAVSVNKSDALLAFGAPLKETCKYTLNLSVTANIDEAAANFFSMLTALAKSDASRICVMPIPNIGLGVAINDRLHMCTTEY